MATDRDDRRLAAPGDLELIRDFINTLDVLPDTDKIGDPASLASWLAEHRLVGHDLRAGHYTRSARSGQRGRGGCTCWRVHQHFSRRDRGEGGWRYRHLPDHALRRGGAAGQAY